MTDDRAGNFDYLRRCESAWAWLQDEEEEGHTQEEGHVKKEGHTQEEGHAQEEGHKELKGQDAGQHSPP